MPHYDLRIPRLQSKIKDLPGGKIQWNYRVTVRCYSGASGLAVDLPDGDLALRLIR